MHGERWPVSRMAEGRTRNKLALAKRGFEFGVRNETARHVLQGQNRHIKFLPRKSEKKISNVSKIS
jgi:hypothetical protein